MSRLGDALAEARTAFAERPRDLVVLCVAAVLVMASYGIARPAAESLFLADYGADGLPWAWLGVAVAATFVTASYNRLAGSMPLARVWPRANVASAAIGVGLWAAHRAGVPHASFALYVWKDLYIVVLVELFWSVANVSYPIRQARWAYGLFLAAGSLGSVVAELSVGPLAQAMGTATSLLAIAPLLFAATALTSLLPQQTRDRPTKGVTTLLSALGRGVRVLASSRYLVLLVALIGVVQIAITVIDYQYNAALADFVPDTDQRTAIAGQIYATTNTAALVLQLASGPLLKLAGVPLVLVGLPLLLATGVVYAWQAGHFVSMAVVKVASKSLDYSLGRAAKELLYIPLSYREKTEGKALVDLLTYRIAKGAASALVLWLTATELGTGAAFALLIALLVVWLGLAGVIGARFRRPLPTEPGTSAAQSSDRAGGATGSP